MLFVWRALDIKMSTHNIHELTKPSMPLFLWSSMIQLLMDKYGKYAVLSFYSGSPIRAEVETDDSFEKAWARMEAEGYSYGEDALGQVHLGWHLARGTLR